jgi:hypothetical protein
MIVAAEIVYLLCMFTAALCAGLLFRGYRRNGTRLLMWSAICFALLCINNVLLFVDVIVLPSSVDLSGWRSVPAIVGIALLCYGLIEESA